MAMSDPLADMLTRIRNAGTAKFEKVDIPLSNLKLGVAKILQDEGYIKNFKTIKDNKQGILRIYLKTAPGGSSVITGLRRLSRPSRRMYVKADEVPRVMNGLGIGIISTSRGIMTDRAARSLGVGGEILCEIW